MRPKKGYNDRLTKEQRSRLMAKVKGKDTKPEMVVRSLIHRLGYRYRLHQSNLPGRPDLIFGSLGKVIFVHGCFWHRHSGCRMTTMPNTRIEFWTNKFNANVARDIRNINELKKQGWRVLTIWECETKDLKKLSRKTTAFLGKKRATKH